MSSRRKFLKITGISGAGHGLSSNMPALLANRLKSEGLRINDIASTIPDQVAFVPHRSASWWYTIEDILWPEKEIIDKIKRRAEAFAIAKIDTAINFDFHTCDLSMKYDILSAI